MTENIVEERKKHSEITKKGEGMRVDGRGEDKSQEQRGGEREAVRM